MAKNNWSQDEDVRPGLGDTLRDRFSQTAAVVADAIGDKIEEKLVYNREDLVADQPKARMLVVVPADQVHVVSGGGLAFLNFGVDKETKIYGQAAKQPGKYYRNGKTIVVPMRTSAFTVSIEGLKVWDSQNVEYYVDVHMVAQLDPEKAVLAAASVGNNIGLLVENIKQYALSELPNNAAKFLLDEVIKDRNLLREKTEADVIATLQKIGYTLNTLRIGDLRGLAVQKKVEESTAAVLRDSQKNINAAELARKQDDDSRARTEAAVQAETDKATMASELSAQEANEIAARNKAEKVAAREHALALANKGREQQSAEAANTVDLRQVELDRLRELAQTQAEAATALEAQNQEKTRELKAAEDDARRSDLVQTRDLARAAEKTTQDAERLMAEKKAEADRQRVVETTRAQAAADALQIQTKAQTDAELLQAGTKAQAAEKTAAADVKLAEATRAKGAAEGLARADVRERELKNEAAQVEITKAEGLAAAEIAEREATVEINRQAGLLKIHMDELSQTAALLAEHPEMMQLEVMKLENAQALAIKQAELAARVQIMEAIAPHLDLRFRVVGSPNSDTLASILRFADGVDVLGEEVPVVGQIIGTNGHTNGGNTTGDLISRFQPLLPAARRVLSSLEPTVWSTLKVSDFLDRMVPVLSGQKQLLQALQEIREDGNFRLISNMDLGALLSLIGLTPDKVAANGVSEAAA